MSQPPLSEIDAEALASFVEKHTCAIQLIPRDDVQEPLGRHDGTGWLFENEASTFVLTCEHVARKQKVARLGYSCFGSEHGVTIEGRFQSVPHPVDAAVASVRKTFAHVSHQGQCATKSLLAARHEPVPGELLYAYGFPGADAMQLFDTQILQGTAVFLREVELDPEVFKEEPPHPDPTLHICLAWSPEHAIPMLGTRGSLSLPDGMSGSPLWNTRYEEITRAGGTWKPTDARITGMIWAHSAKARQLYATPIEAFSALLELTTSS